jgi:hypothetical protein
VLQATLGLSGERTGLGLILQKWQVSRLEELDGASAQQVQEWLEGQ